MKKRNKKHQNAKFIDKKLNNYSHLFNERGGCNKRGGGAKVAKSINVEFRILQLEYSPFVYK